MVLVFFSPTYPFSKSKSIKAFKKLKRKNREEKGCCIPTRLWPNHLTSPLITATELSTPRLPGYSLPSSTYAQHRTGHPGCGITPVGTILHHAVVKGCLQSPST